jgi:hypothetical protein
MLVGRSHRLSRTLDRTASSCARHFQAYVDSTGAADDSELRRSMILALAALSVAAEHSRYTDDALKLACLACNDALAACMRHGFDEELLKCAASLERVVALCERELGV